MKPALVILLIGALVAGVLARGQLVPGGYFGAQVLLAAALILALLQVMAGSDRRA